MRLAMNIEASVDTICANAGGTLRTLKAHLANCRGGRRADIERLGKGKRISRGDSWQEAEGRAIEGAEVSWPFV